MTGGGTCYLGVRPTRLVSTRLPKTAVLRPSPGPQACRPVLIRRTVWVTALLRERFGGQQNKVKLTGAEIGDPRCHPELPVPTVVLMQGPPLFP